MISEVVRGELNRIDKLLCKGDKDAHNLWLILTALRGPDNENLDKVQTTAVVRAAAFPQATCLAQNLMMMNQFGWLSLSPDGVSSALFNKQTFVVKPQDTRRDNHFYSHLEEAAIRLDLEVKTQQILITIHE